MNFENETAAAFDVNADQATPLPKSSTAKLRRSLKPFLDAAKDAAERGLKSSVSTTDTSITVTFEKITDAEKDGANLPFGPLVAGQRLAKSWS